LIVYALYGWSQVAFRVVHGHDDADFGGHRLFPVFDICSDVCITIT
jgi:hypothetical protein